MKRRDLVHHMVDHGCELVREGGNHSWWGNVVLKQRSAVPRHREIPDFLTKKICRDLPRRQARLVEAWAELHQSELIADWGRLQAGSEPLPIEPLP